MKARAFKSSKLYHSIKLASNLSILRLAIVAIVLLNRMTSAIIGGVLLALFWQQVFKTCIYNNLAGLVIGNVWKGFLVEDEA